jgi:thiamine transport system permease protein
MSSYSRFGPSLWPGLAAGAGLLGLATLIFAQIAVLPQTTGPSTGLNSQIWSILRFTLFQAALSALLSIALGIALAWALYHQRHFFGRSVLISLLSSTLVLPTLVAVLGLITVLGRNGWVNHLADALTGHTFGAYLYGLTGILVAHVYFNASFAVRGLLHRLEAIPEEKTKLSRSLGLSAWQRFRLVEWPALKSTLPGMGSTIFLLCFISFSIVLTLGGSPKYNTLEVAIYEAVKFDFDLARALKLALVQLGVCAVLVILASGLGNSNAAISKPPAKPLWGDVRGAQIAQWAIISLCAMGFLAPLAAVFIDGLQADFSKLFSETIFRRALLTSLALASASSLTTLILALAIGFARRNFTVPGRVPETVWTRVATRLLSFSGTLYLAIPSLVLGLGFFLLARQFSGSLNFWAVTALLCANVLMALPFSLAILVPAMEKTARRFDRLCFSLGITGSARWQLAEWPFLRADLGYVAALAFCFSLGDLGVIALFGSQDFATLPWLLFQKMGSYRTDDAAGIALILLALTIAVFTLVPRLFAGKSPC